MIASVFLLAAALSAGNAELEEFARSGAADIVLARAKSALAATGPAAGTLKGAMLAEPARFAAAADAERECREVWSRAAAAAFAVEVQAVRDRLQLGDDFRPEFDAATSNAVMERFAAAYRREREEACQAQAEGLAARVKPNEAEFEGDRAQVRAALVRRIAEAQQGGVFEENLKYISETIVEPLLADADKERQRQAEYLMRSRTDAFAPSVLANDLAANLRRNTAERAEKCADPVRRWGVFPSVLGEPLTNAVRRRSLDRVVKVVDDVKVEVSAAALKAEIARDRVAHRRMAESERIFRNVFTSQVQGGAVHQAAAAAPAAEREEFTAFVTALPSPALAKAVEARIRRELLPAWREARTALAEAEAARLEPALADGTWTPPVALADAVAARSDYARVVSEWRQLGALTALAEKVTAAEPLEESERLVDARVAAAFDLARSAIIAQNQIVTEVSPAILQEARSRKASLFRFTPSLEELVSLLTQAVESRWGEKREQVLWPDGKLPANAASQHVELYPSVRERIEMVARQLFEQMEQPEVSPESKPKPEEEPEPKPEEPPPEEISQGAGNPEEQLLKFRIVVSKGDDGVEVKLERGKEALMERKVAPKLGEFRAAMEALTDKLGRELLELK